MKLVSVAILLFCAATIQAAPRIEGGKDAPEGKYPYQVAVKRASTNFYICGGSILNKRYILTAAFCVKGETSMIVLAGTNSLDNESGQVYESESLIYHSEYDSTTGFNDIALIKVKSDIKFSDKVKPIDLPTETFTKLNYPVSLAGWGFKDTSQKPSRVLQEITLLTIGNEVCDDQVYQWKTIIKSQICTIEVNDGGPCYLDQGSPLVADNVQIAIFSDFALGCGLGHPDIYTRVYDFIDWIKANTEN